MRSLILTALAIGICMMPASQRVRQSEKSGNQQSTTTANKTIKGNQGQQPLESEAISSIEASIEKIQQQQAQTLQAIENQNKEDVATQRKLVFYTLALAIVGGLQFLALIGQAIVFIYTLRAIQHEALIAADIANAARDNAGAAQRNATALMNIERAWLVPDGFVIPMELPSVHIVAAQVEQLTVRIRNCGRTPAWVTEWIFKTVVADSADPQGLFDYSSPNTSLRGVPLAPNTTENFFVEWVIRSPSEIDDIRTGRRHFYVYGFVKYDDIFGTVAHDTHICFHHFQRRDTRGHIEEGWEVEPPHANRFT